MKKTDTRIGQRKRQYAASRRHILAAFGWDANDYNDRWLDGGRAFLDRHYPRSDARYAGRHRRITADERYWHWWLREWKLRETCFVRVSQAAGLALDEERYYLFMQVLLQGYSLVEVSFFENYVYKLKRLKDVKNEKSLN